MNYQSMSIQELVEECAKNLHADLWTEFRRRFQRLIASVVIKACGEWGESSVEILEDLVQDTYLKLLSNNCSILAEFKPHHENAFLGYLKKVTANVVYDYWRKEHAEIRDMAKTVELDEASQVQSVHGQAEAMENEIFCNEVDSLLRQLGTTEKERTIFWLHIRQRMTCKEIASIPGIDLKTKGVESAVHRLKELLKEELV
jgi:RNA polymerase sigma factor (sigma-70 family)